MPVNPQVLWIVAVAAALAVGWMAAFVFFRRERRVFAHELRSLWERLDAIFYRSPMAISLCERDPAAGGLLVVDCNEQACALYGGSRAELVGQVIHRLDPAAAGAEQLEAWLSARRADDTWAGEKKLRRIDGVELPIAYVWSWVDVGGRELVLAVERDVSEQRRAEAALKDSEQRFRQIVASANCLLWKAHATEVDGRLEWKFHTPNSALRQRLFDSVGISLSENDLWGSFNIPEMPDMHQRCWQALHTDAPSFRQEFRVIGRQETIWLSEQVEIERVSATEWNLVGVVVDITRSKEAEKATRMSEERNQLVLKASNDGIWDYDAVTGRFEASERCRTMLGLTPEQMPTNAEAWRTLIHSDDLAVEKAAWEKHHAMGEPCVYQARFRHGDGSWRWLLVGVITVNDGAGRPVRVVGSHTDITDLKRRDGELQQSRRLRAIGELVGGIAHEFNNLLTPMLLQTTMIQDGIAPGGSIKEQLKPVIAAITEARELTQRILTFGRRASVNPETLDFVAVVNDNLELLRHTIDRRVRIELVPVAEPMWVLQSRTDVAQIVINLVLNARDTLLERAAAQPPAGWSPSITVEFTTVQKNGTGPVNGHSGAGPTRWHRLTVGDNGMGMSDEVRERIFEPFYTTKEVGQGTGLGLATVWHLIKTMGGRVEVDTAVGRGSSFHVLLPATAAPNGSSVVPRHDFSVPAAVRRARILLADDQPQVAATLSSILRRWGHTVTIASDGGGALRLLAANGTHFDVCITDLNMPGATGFEVARTIRERALKMKVVIVGGYLTPQVRRTLTELNIDALVPKPFSMDDIATAMRVCGW